MNLNCKLIPAALLLGGCAPQLPSPPAPTPVAAPAPAPARALPRVVTLPGAVCDRARTAETIMRVQLAADRLMVIAQADPAYGGAWYEHSPCYRIVLAFKDGQPRQWVVDAAEPELRPYIAFGRTRFSQAERERARPEIMAALSAAGARTEIFVVSLDPEGFMVGVPTERDAQIARRAIPERYRDITRVEVGNFAPIPERESSLDAKVLRQPQLTMSRIAELQLQVIPLNQAVRQMPGYSELYIEHEPTWHVVVAFTDPPPRDQVLRLASAGIRDRIVLRRAKRTQAQINTDLETMAEAFRSGGFDFTGGYDVKAQRFSFTVGTADHQKRAIALVPTRLRADVDVSVGPLPVPE